MTSLFVRVAASPSANASSSGRLRRRSSNTSAGGSVTSRSFQLSDVLRRPYRSVRIVFSTVKNANTGGGGHGDGHHDHQGDSTGDRSRIQEWRRARHGDDSPRPQEGVGAAGPGRNIVGKRAASGTGTP